MKGGGRAASRSCHGHSKLAWHIATSVVLDEFDLTIMNEMSVDHGLTVPLSLMLGQPTEWPVKVIPLAVNVIQYPTPTANRCFRLGEAIARAVKSFPEDLNVQIWGTGGMSHQLSGERAGLINREWDTRFWTSSPRIRMRCAPCRTRSTSVKPVPKGMELIMWLTMRGALGKNIRELHRFYHVPASNTAVGNIVFTPEN